MPRMIATCYTWYCSALLLGCTLCMVVWLTGIQYLSDIHVLAFQRSLTVVRPSQALHDATCEGRIMFVFFSTVSYRTCTEQAGSRRGITDTRRFHPMMSGWFPSRIVVARVYTGVEDARYLSIHMPRKARRNGH